MRSYILLFFLVISLSLFGQVQQPDRLEIELDSYEEPFSVLPGEENGVLLYRETGNYESGKQQWSFINLDTSLNKTWVRNYYINERHIFKGYDYHNSNYYFLFQITEHNSHDLLMIQMHESSGDTVMHTIKNLVHLDLFAFEMSDEAAIIGGYFNQDPVVIYYSLNTTKTKVLPGIYGGKTELVQIKIEEEVIKVVVTARTFDNKNTLTLKTYDRGGNYLDNFTFTPEGDVGLIYGRVAEVGERGSIISGTYGAKRSDFSRGLFIGQHKVGEEQVLKYFNFADLDNFFTYLKAKRQTRVSNKITRKKVKGKKVKFNYRLLVHEIIETGDTYVMLGEAFYPKYTNESLGSTRDFHAPGSYYMPRSFAGYKYTHAVVIGFDKNGKKLWDNSFQIEDVLTYSLEQYVHADVLNEKVVLFYLYDNEIRTKIINGSEVLEGKSLNSVKLMFEDDVASKNHGGDIGGLEKWYDHNFLAYGVQKIKNLKDDGVKLNRRVFYINKIHYEEPKKSASELSE